MASMIGNATFSAVSGREALRSFAGGICQKLSAPGATPAHELAFDVLGAFVIGFGVGLFNLVAEHTLYAIYKGLETRGVIRRICPSIPGRTGTLSFTLLAEEASSLSFRQVVQF